MNKCAKWLTTLTIAAVVCSCSNYKKFTYLQDVADIEQVTIGQIPQVKARKGDVLNIYVSSRNPESAIPFNLTARGSSPGAANNAQFSSVQRSLGYVVNELGNIDFPQLGTLHVEGMSRDEIISCIKAKLNSSDQLKDAIVSVEFQNLKISVTGEVNNAGTFEMNNDHTTLFEAIAMAGDLTVYGCRDRVAVIREENGKCTIKWHDLRSKEIFDSPYYYLQQNDIVYVQPNKAKATQSSQSRWNQPSVWISIISTAISVVTLVKLLAK